MDKPKVLIIGASGLVGEEILKTTEGMGQEIVTLSRRKADIKKPRYRRNYY